MRSEDVKWGLAYGGAFAGVYSLIAGGIAVVQGIAAANLLAVVGVYLSAGLASGLLLGIFRQKIISRTRAMALGIVIAFPASFLIGFAVEGATLPMDSDAVTTSVLMAVFFGMWGGWVFGPRKNKGRSS